MLLERLELHERVNQAEEEDRLDPDVVDGNIDETIISEASEPRSWHFGRSSTDCRPAMGRIHAPHRAGSSRGSTGYITRSRGESPRCSDGRNDQSTDTEVTRISVTPVWLNRFGLASFEEQRRGVKGDAQSLGQAEDVEDQAVAGQQLGVAVGHLEEDLDQDLDPGTSQVVDGDLVLLLPHVGLVPDQLQDPFAELDQHVRGCHGRR